MTATARRPQPDLWHLLHVGCGDRPCDGLQPGWTETRLDIDPWYLPDIVASMTDMGDIGGFHMVYCCHALEHVYPREVPMALAEFLRVLLPSGRVIVGVPDLEGISADETVLYETPDGPITGLDLIYGVRHEALQGPYMAHRTGFVSATLRAALAAAGFEDVEIRRLPEYNLLGVGTKP